MEVLNSILNKIIIYSLISIFIFSCTPSPRYQGNGKSIPTPTKKRKSSSKSSSNYKKKKKFNKAKKLYRGTASYYGPKFHGKLTANGEIFDMYGVTAAHKEFPFNTVARVTNENNGKSHIIRINDRGPYIDGRILDCSYGAAKKLDFVTQGTAPVKIEILEWGDGIYMHHK